MSYAREDAGLTASVRTALKARGFNVWWDGSLLVADPWQEKIESALANASSVVILWSQHAIESDWVRHEASFAKLTKKAVFVQLDNAEVPSIFSSLQSAELTSWDGNYESREMDRLVSSIKRVHRRRIYSLAKRSLPLLVVLIGASIYFLIISESLSECKTQLKAAVELADNRNALPLRGNAIPNGDGGGRLLSPTCRDGKVIRSADELEKWIRSKNHTTGRLYCITKKNQEHTYRNCYLTKGECIANEIGSDKYCVSEEPRELHPESFFVYESPPMVCFDL